ncbi:MAG: hypothetical protein ACXAE3_08130 [Candidatus Kariarchaeaceae archaeon]|jgi:cytoskeletal protein CcmA (bactofilin family)
MSRQERLQDKLNAKLQAGEIDQEEYDALMKKFEDLDLLGTTVGRSKNYSYSGSKTMAGGEIAEPVKVSGRLKVTDSLVAPAFTVSGSAGIDGSLTVTGPTKISGSLTVEEEAKFGEPLKLSGKLKSKSLFLTGGGKISGKLEVDERIVSEESLKISGGVEATNIQSTGSVVLSGKLNLAEGLIAKEFVSKGGPGTIGGSIDAEKVEVAKRFRTGGDGITDDIDTSNLESIPELGKFIGEMVTKFIPKVMTSVMGQRDQGEPKILEVKGDVKGQELDISYTTVGGDIIGDNIIIGPGVTVSGTIKYVSTVTLPDDSDYRVEQISK